jgi:DNA-binding MarR family transcriptional regulator
VVLPHDRWVARRLPLDPVIHAPARLTIVALLAAAQQAEFSFVRDQVGVSDSVLSEHASALEAAGYVEIRKGHVGKRPRTWLELTDTGRAAFAAHVAALQRIVAQAGQTLVPERAER